MPESTYVPANGTTAVEDIRQKEVATGNQWLLARVTTEYLNSRELISSLGLVITGTEGLFYLIETPEGWYRECAGYHTDIYDNTGKRVLHQFVKLAGHANRAWIRAV
jgi:hypothetical protein